MHLFLFLFFPCKPLVTLLLGGLGRSEGHPWAPTSPAVVLPCVMPCVCVCARRWPRSRPCLSHAGPCRPFAAPGPPSSSALHLRQLVCTGGHPRGFWGEHCSAGPGGRLCPWHRTRGAGEGGRPRCAQEASPARTQPARSGRQEGVASSGLPRNAPLLVGLVSAIFLLHSAHSPRHSSSPPSPGGPGHTPLPGWAPLTPVGSHPEAPRGAASPGRRQACGTVRSVPDPQRVGSRGLAGGDQL